MVVFLIAPFITSHSTFGLAVLLISAVSRIVFLIFFLGSCFVIVSYSLF